jgi:predicted nucleic acid-binding protein
MKSSWSEAVSFDTSVPSKIRRASMVHDLLIALSARSLGATVLTTDADFEKIARIVDVRVQIAGR